MDQQECLDLVETIDRLQEENRQLREAVETTGHGKALLRQQEEFSRLLSVSTRIVSELDVTKVFNLVADNARRIVNAELVLVPMLNEKRDRYTYMAGSGLEAASVCGTSHKANVGMCGWVLRHERSLLFGEESSFWMEEKTPWEAGQQSAVLVPLFGREEIIGGLSALGKQGGGAFTRHDLDLLTMFANQVSIAIENALLFQQRLLFEQGLQDVNECFLSFGVDPLENIKSITRTTGKILNATCSRYNRKEGDQLRVIAGWQLPPDMPLTDTGKGRLCFEIIERGGNEPVVVRNLKDTSYAETDPNIRRLGLNLYVGCPVSAAGQPPSSSLCAAFQKDTEISPYQLSLLRVLGKAASVEEERLRADIALRASETRFRTMIESASVGILAVDIDTGRFRYANPVICRMLGFQESELLTMDIRAIHPEEELPRIEQTFSKCEGLQTRCVRRDGSQFWVDIKPVMVELDGISCLVGFFTDITERHLLEAERLKTLKLESVGVLAGGIAHDFNNILTSILGNINLALFDPKLNEKTKRLLTEAEKASLRARDLTQQLLTFSKGGDPVKETSSLETIIEDSANFVLHGDKVACQFQIPEDLWLVDVDKGQISQVIQNVVLNARNAMPEGGVVKIRCENIHSEKRNITPNLKKGRFVKICIEDSGEGIPQNLLDKIFDPYFTTKQNGSGLGLAITQSIITKHGGHIAVKSFRGQGSRFTIYLPATEKLATAQENAAAETKTISQAKILVMDDDEMVRGLAKEMLRKMGHEVVLAEHGEEALRHYEEAMNANSPFDLVILDLTIPGGMGGKDTVREILARDPDAKAVASSGYSNDPIMASCRKYGFCAAITKPYRFQDLSRVINQAQQEA